MTFPNGGWRVLWTRGDGCRELAPLLGDAKPVEGELRAACLRARADLLVARKLTSFGLVSIAVPHDFRRAAVGGVVAAVGGGPHSALAAIAAERLGRALEVSAAIATASRSSGEDAAAELLLAEMGSLVPGTPAKVVRAETVRQMVAGLPEGSLLVVGAPGGSWMQRQFFGPGRRLIVRATAGAIVVRRAPTRCFQVMETPMPFGSAMPVQEARRLLEDSVAPVVEEGRLIGIVRRSALLTAPAGGDVTSVAEDPISVRDDDSIEVVSAIAASIDPIPVVDADGRLRGVIRR
ncbi:MAG: CBS domain-containing protein [Actinomycetota bacterium]